ncbi:MAG: hypothetical protein ACO25K_08305, partial [Candidatus Fonsibacter ubiquis]
YLVRQKNGELVLEPINHLLQSQLSADPMVKAVYDTKAYVNRKNWSYQNADKYGGVKQAEMKYLEDGFKELKTTTEKNHANLQERSKIYDAKIADIEKQLKNNGPNPVLEKSLKEYKDNKAVNDNLLASYATQLEFFNGAYSSSGNTSTGFHNPYSDINSLRYLVDNTMAGDLFAEDIQNAASDLSKKDMVIEYKADPYGIISARHNARMAEINKQAYYDKYDYDGNLKPVKNTNKSGGGKGGGGKGGGNNGGGGNSNWEVPVIKNKDGSIKF